MKKNTETFHPKHETHKEVLLKFISVLAIFVAYFYYLSTKYDAQTGLIVSLLTWSFFVMCTPVASAGLLLDLPLRLITGLKMIYSETIVWIIAIVSNIITFNVSPESYDITVLTSVFHNILSHPVPYWIIIILCGTGTFLSISFCDEMVDVLSHKDREHYHKNALYHKGISLIIILTIVIITYNHLLTKYGLDIF